MKKENCFKSSFIRICACLITLLIVHPLGLFAEQADIDKVVTIKDNRITMNPVDEATFNQLKNTDIEDVLKKIEKETGIKMTIGEGLAGKKLHTDFVDVDIESAIKQLLNGTYYVLHYEQDTENKDKHILKEVRVGGPEFGSIPIRGKVTSIEIPYGSDKGEIGAYTGSEGAMGGPYSYTVDDDGNIYICDTLNERVNIYSSAGTYLSTISLMDEALNKDKNRRVYTHSLTDVAVDSFGSIYIFDSTRRELYEYDAKGNYVGNVATEDGRELSLSIIGNAIYMRSGETERLIAKILPDGKKVKPAQKEIDKNKEDAKKGKLELNGRRYKGKNYGGGFNTEMTVTEKDGRQSMSVSFPPRKGIVPAGTLEDEEGNQNTLYSRDEDNFKLYYVDKFNSNAEYIGTAQIPGGHHYFPSGKNFYLKHGKIYHLITEKEKLKIHVLTIQDK